MNPVSIARRPHGVLTVTLSGDIDYTNATSVADVIRAAVRMERPASIHVDMAAVDFLDSSGIAVLVKAMKAAVTPAAVQFNFIGSPPECGHRPATPARIDAPSLSLHIRHAFAAELREFAENPGARRALRIMEKFA